ncbi:hypothetical protein CEXT_420161 [Caerostris extrusa]|uniref:Uncharacterized protein n=1 Tax=Caerostris extrusa TaxID=172846 RepID=A0AAV4TPM6_CAEEX|nr:hypothetical protein CEXT_420161 [Caerostris extrusa]
MSMQRSSGGFWCDSKINCSRVDTELNKSRHVLDNAILPRNILRADVLDHDLQSGIVHSAMSTSRGMFPNTQ